MGVVLLRANLLHDFRHQVLQLLGLGLASHDQEVFADGELNERLSKVEDSAVILELLDGRFELAILLDRGDDLDLLGASLGTFAAELGLFTTVACSQSSASLLNFVLIV